MIVRLRLVSRESMICHRTGQPRNGSGLVGLWMVFGFRVLTYRGALTTQYPLRRVRSIRRRSERRGIPGAITPINGTITAGIVAAMIDQREKRPVAGFQSQQLRYLSGRMKHKHLKAERRPGGWVIWQVAIVDASEKNLHYWYRLMQKARLAAPITEAQIRLAQGFLRELDPDMSDLHNLQQRYNDLFLPEDGVHWLH